LTARPSSTFAKRALAPAKVNLFLHVGALAPDGYHPLSSLMVFADVGDVLTLEPAAETAFVVEGAFASALAGEDPAGNLAWRAGQALLARAGASPPPFRLRLDKRLPVAAGLGGGSSDAGAALKLVRDAFAPQVDDALLEAIALELGADGPACLHARSVLAEGRGERLSPPPRLPPLPAVLVNPGVACSTGAVYRAYDRAPVADGARPPPLAEGFGDPTALIAALAQTRNDLEPPALTVAPAIADVLAELRAAPQAGLARLSGSGATCFALCADDRAARELAEVLQAKRPQWWVRACRLAAAPADHEAVIGETDIGSAA
jgi:4-diphosphocytidyl-2-C-methyl-D-erythritol kinase